MSKRAIGIEIGDGALRLAILTRDRGEVSIVSLVEREYAGDGGLATVLGEELGGSLHFGDCLATAMPARSAYVRKLAFPFPDEKKIAAALPFELAVQLPVAVEACAIAALPPQKDGTGAAVAAAAVPTATLQPLLDAFEAAAVPLQIVDLSPYGQVAGLGELLGSVLLVCAGDQETTLSLVRDGVLVDSRALRGAAGLAPAFVNQLAREIRMLRRGAEGGTLPVMLTGRHGTGELAEALRAAEPDIELLAVVLGGREVPAEYLTAVALALRARQGRECRSFNFRQGAFALRDEWSKLKRRLITLAAICGLTLLVLAGSMAARYIDKSRQAAALQETMVADYRALFPNAATIVDVPLQMQSALRALQERASLVRGGASPALTALREISRLPATASMEIQEFALDGAELKLTGWTDSFETVNRLAGQLRASAAFGNVQVTDAKMSLDGSRVDFRMLLALAAPGGDS